MSGRTIAARISLVAVAVVLAGCGGTITATRPTDLSVPTTATTEGAVTHSTASESARATSPAPAVGNEGAAPTTDEPTVEEQPPGEQDGNGAVVVSPLQVSEYIKSQGVVWAIHKPILDKGIADYCNQARLPANCVGIDVDTSGDPSTGYGPCAIHNYEYHEPIYPGDRITVILESPCSDDGLTPGARPSESPDSSDSSDSSGGSGVTDSTDATDITDGTPITENPAGAGGTGGDSTPSQ